MRVAKKRVGPNTTYEFDDSKILDANFAVKASHTIIIKRVLCIANI